MKPLWPGGSVLGLRPPGLDFLIPCLQGSVISFISLSSGGSPGSLAHVHKGGLKPPLLNFYANDGNNMNNGIWRAPWGHKVYYYFEVYSGDDFSLCLLSDLNVHPLVLCPATHNFKWGKITHIFYFETNMYKSVCWNSHFIRINSEITCFIIVKYSVGHCSISPHNITVMPVEPWVGRLGYTCHLSHVRIMYI